MTETAQQTGGQFAIQRIYTKDLSFESPRAPGIFREDWKPQMSVDLSSQAAMVDQDVHEVTLSVTVTVKVDDKTAFLAEVKQAGIFTLQGFPPDQVGPMLGSFCPNVLFPYAREAISDLVGRGGFPPLYLSPVNFDAVYAEHLRRQQAEKPDEASSH